MNNKNKFVILILIFFLPTILFAEYDFNDNCKTAYQQIMNMRFDDVASTLDNEQRSNPDNLYIPFLRFYSDMVKLIITDDPNLYDKIKGDFDAYIVLMEKDEKSPYYKILKSEMLFHLSVANMKYGDKFTGARNLVRANKHYLSNVEDHPGFWLNNKMGGTFNIVFSFIPSSFQWAAKVIGLKGSRDVGIKQLNQYHKDAAATPGMAEESVLYVTLGRKYGGNDMDAYSYIREVNPRYYENPLVKYIYAVLCVRSFNNEKGLELVQSLDTESFQVSFYPYDYLTGKAKLNRLDDDAIVHMERFYFNAPGKGYKKEICYNIAQFYLVQNNLTEFEQWKSRVEDIGNDMTDRDREAEVESKCSYQPIPELVKVKLLFEGGYFEKAEIQLLGISDNKISTEPYDIEYTYWEGRIMQETGKYQDAVTVFKRLLNPDQSDYYFAADAAYQLGYIFENSKQYELALQYYQTSLDLNESDWEGFIEIKVERGIGRVSKR